MPEFTQAGLLLFLFFYKLNLPMNYCFSAPFLLHLPYHINNSSLLSLAMVFEIMINSKGMIWFFLWIDKSVRMYVIRISWYQLTSKGRAFVSLGKVRKSNVVLLKDRQVRIFLKPKKFAVLHEVHEDLHLLNCQHGLDTGDPDSDQSHFSQPFYTRMELTGIK